MRPGLGRKVADAFASTIAAMKVRGGPRVIRSNLGPWVVALPQTNAAGQSGVALATVPNATGLSGAIALTAAQTIAFQSSDIVLDRLSEVREEQRKQTGQQVAELPGNAMAYAKMPVKANPIQVNDPVNPTVKPAMWARAFGDFEDRTGQANFVFGGQNFGATWLPPAEWRRWRQRCDQSTDVCAGRPHTGSAGRLPELARRSARCTYHAELQWPHGRRLRDLLQRALVYRRDGEIRCAVARRQWTWGLPDR
jgi:hypothetical protein